MSGSGRGVPEDVVERAKAAFSLRTPPGELIPLTAAVFFDADDQRPTEHRLTFERTALSVRVRVVASREGASVQVDVEPSEVTTVELQVQDSEGGVQPIAPEDSPSHSPGKREGSFIFRLPRAIVRVHVIGTSVSRHVYSEWFRL